MNNYLADINSYMEDVTETIKALDKDELNHALNVINEAYENEKTVYVFGNGGSSSTASHMQNDFNKGLSEHLPKKFNFLCLNDNVSTMMAVANDISFDEVFRFQLQGHIKKDDICVAISGSGNSANVINAVEYAKAQGAVIIGMTGCGEGGKLRRISDVSLHVPNCSMQITEDLHLFFNHLMMSTFKKQFNITY